MGISEFLYTCIHVPLKAFDEEARAECALKSGGNQSDVSVAHDIKPSTLNELIQLFIDGKLETDVQELRHLER